MSATAKIIPPVVSLSTARIVDDLGAVRAQIAELKLREEALASAVKAEGFGAYEGALFRATVSEVASSTTLDPKAAEAKLRELGVDGRWFSKHQKVRAASVAIRVVARKGA
jgi:hypothetical protein